MRKSILAVVFVFAMSLPGLAFGDAVVSVSSPATVSQGDTFAVDVDIAEVIDLFAYQLDLNFNPSILQATGTITEGSFFQSGGGFVPGTIDNTLGSITSSADTLLGPSPGIDGNGTLIEFQFLAVGAGTSVLDLANIILLDSTLSNIEFTTTNASVTVTGSGPVPTPEPSILMLLAGASGAVALFWILKKL